jgi:Tol biopolymer transport system component
MRTLLLVSLPVLLLSPMQSHVRAITTTASPTGGEIAFSTDVSGVSQVFTIDANGTSLRQMTHSKTGAGNAGLTWSPNGANLLFTVTGAKGIDRLVCSRADGSHVTPISPPCTATCLGDDEPAYSPDGKKIAFERAFGPIVNTATPRASRSSR